MSDKENDDASMDISDLGLGNAQDLASPPSSSDPSLSQNPHLSDLIEKRTKNAELREKYQEMCLALAEKQEALGAEDADDTDDVMTKMAEMLEQNSDSMGVREIAAQADFFKKSAEYLMLRASQLATADAGETFNPSAFAQNLISYLKKGYKKYRRDDDASQHIDDATHPHNHLLAIDEQEIDDAEEAAFYSATQTFANQEIPAKHWAWFGRKTAHILNETPYFDFIRPAIDDTRIPLAAKPKKATARKDRTDKDQELVLKNRERTEQDELEGISKELDIVHKSFKRACAKFDNVVPYYHFVIDPNDFGKTVENMFYVSFLLKDVKVEVKLDQNDLPVIIPVNMADRNAILNKGSEWPNCQNVRDFSYQQWEQIKKILKITKPMIEDVVGQPATPGSVSRRRSTKASQRGRAD
ncbi:hypothetical protein WR25_07390 [Diploscapter pachys]|uniref:Non-structural maintenance of chromosomes element 4 n=1 Tax=Diploscapter pachys TaxID=2018661 RepID=A0A2A2J7J8_9BILA|nr:hypothetical protein WR25_07390 [Diploscapter pachys]